jgi:hypothetical protein
MRPRDRAAEAWIGGGAMRGGPVSAICYLLEKLQKWHGVPNLRAWATLIFLLYRECFTYITFPFFLPLLCRRNKVVDVGAYDLDYLQGINFFVQCACMVRGN